MLTIYKNIRIPSSIHRADARARATTKTTRHTRTRDLKPQARIRTRPKPCTRARASPSPASASVSICHERLGLVQDLDSQCSFTVLDHEDPIRHPREGATQLVLRHVCRSSATLRARVLPPSFSSFLVGRRSWFARKSRKDASVLLAAEGGASQSTTSGKTRLNSFFSTSARLDHSFLISAALRVKVLPPCFSSCLVGQSPCSWRK